MIVFLFYIIAILFVLIIAAAIADFAGWLWPEWDPGADE